MPHQNGSRLTNRRDGCEANLTPFIFAYHQQTALSSTIIMAKTFDERVVLWLKSRRGRSCNVNRLRCRERAWFEMHRHAMVRRGMFVAWGLRRTISFLGCWAPKRGSLAEEGNMLIARPSFVRTTSFQSTSVKTSLFDCFVPLFKHILRYFV